MPWLYLLLAIGAFAVAFTTHSPAVMGLSLFAALVLTVLWLMGLLAQRMGNAASGGPVLRLDPEEVRRLREQAEARKQQAANQAGAPSAAQGGTTDAATPVASPGPSLSAGEPMR